MSIDEYYDVSQVMDFIPIDDLHFTPVNRKTYLEYRELSIKYNIILKYNVNKITKLVNSLFTCDKWARFIKTLIMIPNLTHYIFNYAYTTQNYRVCYFMLKHKQVDFQIYDSFRILNVRNCYYSSEIAYMAFRVLLLEDSLNVNNYTKYKSAFQNLTRCLKNYTYTHTTLITLAEMAIQLWNRKSDKILLPMLSAMMLSLKKCDDAFEMVCKAIIKHIDTETMGELINNIIAIENNNSHSHTFRQSNNLLNIVNKHYKTAPHHIINKLYIMRASVYTESNAKILAEFKYHGIVKDYIFGGYEDKIFENVYQPYEALQLMEYVLIDSNISSLDLNKVPMVLLDRKKMFFHIGEFLFDKSRFL